MNRPNIIFILADDMGYWTLGSAGNMDAITPNLDRLAENGCIMDNFFCASPVCSPARATLLTGKMPSEHGILDWISSGNVEQQEETAIEYLRELKGYTDYLNQEGYDCAISGKWHLGNSEKVQKGFSHWYVHQFGGGAYYSAPMIKDGEKVCEKGYITDAITQDAVEYIKSRSGREKPFYLGVHYTAPHTPWIRNHPQKYLDMYKECAFLSCPVEKRHPWQIDFEEFNHDREEMLAGYFAAVTALDDGVGRIYRELEEQNLERQTLVIFSSDNGFNCGHHGIWGKGNGTYPFNMYDTSVKVPMIACMPGQIPAGRRLKGLYSAYDFFPSIMDIAGITYRKENLDGKSFARAWFGTEEEKGDECVVVYNEYGSVRMLRQEEWKYVCRYPGGPDELYYLKEDPDEKDNIVDKAEPELVQSLHDRLEKWFLDHSRPEMDGRLAGVTGAGQIKIHTAHGFEPDSFHKRYKKQ